MLKQILIMDTDTDITDHTDTTGDTMERELLMRPQLQVQTLMLKLMLMLGMDTMDRDLLMKPQLLAQILMLMLMLGMDIMVTDMDMDITDHTDTGDTMERDLLMKPQLP